MKNCPGCGKDKVNRFFKRNTKKCIECNKKICEVCGNIFFPTGKKTHCSSKCNILGNIKKNENDCWIWQKHKDKCGYGRIRNPETKKLILAHRLSYIIFKGEIQEGKLICHTCDNPSCINPEHLWIGNFKDNSQDAKVKGRVFRVSYDSRGEKNGNAKIKEDDVRKIRKMSLEGIGDLEIAKIYGFSRTNVRRIRNGSLWKNVK